MESDYLQHILRDPASRARFYVILASATKIIKELGFEALSLEELALQTGMRIEALELFFPDKNALLEGLIYRYQDSFLDIFPDDVGAKRSLETILGEFILHLERPFADPAFRAVFLRDDPLVNTHFHQEILNWFDLLLSIHFPHLSPEQSQQQATYSFGILMGLLRLSLAPHHIPLKTLAQPLQQALLGYWDKFL